MPEQSLADQIEFVPIDSVQPHPQNPRQGDVGLVAVSIAENGWFGACLVQRKRRGRAQTDTMVAGEHRWRGLLFLQQNGYDRPDGTHLTYEQLRGIVPLPPEGQVPIIPRAWTDEQALKVLLADNRTSDNAAYDDGRLAELLTTLAETDALLGTGFDGDDLDQLLRDLDTDVNVPLQDQRTVEERAHVFNTTDVRQVVTIISPDEFDAAVDILEAAMRTLDLATHSDAAMAIWQQWGAANEDAVSAVRAERDASVGTDA
jgi:hypothetical protein